MLEYVFQSHLCMFVAYLYHDMAYSHFDVKMLFSLPQEIFNEKFILPNLRCHQIIKILDSGKLIYRIIFKLGFISLCLVLIEGSM